MTSVYLLFLLSGRLFGMKLRGAIEILPWRLARPVPLSYSYVEGLINYRGTVYPVFNLTQRLGLSKRGPIGFTADDSAHKDTSRSIILLEENKVPFGISVDSVVKMANLPASTPGSGKSDEVDEKFVKGVTYEDDQEILILDFERLLHVG